MNDMDFQKISENPIEYYQDLFSEETATGERFGLNFTYTETTEVCGTHTLCQSVPQSLDISSSSYGDLVHRISGSSLCHHFFTNSASRDPEDDNTDSEQEIEFQIDNPLHASVDQSITVPVLKDMLFKALMWFYTYKEISHRTDTARIPVQSVPFMSRNVSCNFFDAAMVDPLNDQHEKRLERVLQSWNFSRVSAPRDGDFLYYVVAYNLRQQVQTGNIPLKNFLKCKGIRIDADMKEMVMTLRRLTVAEWVGEHSAEYQEFLTSGQLQEQALQFLQSGHFAADVGDLVVTALSNVLQCPIVLLTSAENMPIVVQHPTHAQMVNVSPVYIELGSGHYDAVNPQKRSDLAANNNRDIGHPSTAKDPALLNISNKEPKKSCMCGKKASMKGTPSLLIHFE